MTLKSVLLPLIAAATLAASLSHASFADIAGGQDHPVTGRYDGSEMTGYSAREFDTYTTWTGAAFPLEGQVTEIAYQMPEGVTPVAAMRNFANRLQQQGYAPEFACNAATDRKACSRDLTYAVSRLPSPRMVVDSFNYAYTLFRDQGSGTTYVALLASENNGRTYLQASVIELEALQFKMVDADEIADELTQLGHIALYGIRFDTDSATLTPDSLDTLAELTKYLQAHADKEIMIVGHTDNQGTLDYNIALSTRRAEAVRSHLANALGSSGELMRAAGVGFLAPVASNATEAGRSQNRRVEIVAR
ncbi:OmpA family protein [uncultured Litoreibacter sp.]|uniref:OmpA family protein n=1 Tax=uncultured Litoreibacter sp. TaxID=1392394 RepID=UPI00262EF2D5|nr:OmpA family protein [uncultured Litoreibacter sp.]